MTPFPPRLFALALFAGLALAVLTVEEPVARFATMKLEAANAPR